MAMEHLYNYMTDLNNRQNALRREIENKTAELCAINQIAIELAEKVEKQIEHDERTTSPWV